MHEIFTFLEKGGSPTETVLSSIKLYQITVMFPAENGHLSSTILSRDISTTPTTPRPMQMDKKHCVTDTTAVTLGEARGKAVLRRHGYRPQWLAEEQSGFHAAPDRMTVTLQDNGNTRTLPPSRDSSRVPSAPCCKRRGQAPSYSGQTKMERRVIDISSSPDVPRSPVNMSPRRRKVAPQGDGLNSQKGQAGERKKFIVLRESLPGSWKEVDEFDIEGRRSRAWRQSQVEILDMTAD
jgi:hypothetical protein